MTTAYGYTASTWLYGLSYADENPLPQLLRTAHTRLGFNPNYADSFGAWLVQEHPELDGTVYDETPFSKTRTQLSNQAATLATNQSYQTGVSSSTSKTTISGFAAFSPTAVSGIQVIAGEIGRAHV